MKVELLESKKDPVSFDAVSKSHFRELLTKAIGNKKFKTFIVNVNEEKEIVSKIEELPKLFDKYQDETGGKMVINCLPEMPITTEE